MAELCPRCGAQLQLNNGQAVCSACAERTEAEDLFLSGSAYLSLSDYVSAAEKFFAAAKLSPTDPKNWLYLLCAITERFTVLYPIALEKETRNAGSRRIVCRSVYKNFISTAKKEDLIFAKSEFDIDLDPKGGELWESIVIELLRADRSLMSAEKAAAVASVAVSELKASNPEAAKRYAAPLCAKINPVRDGVLEINSLSFYEPDDSGVLKIETNADSIEFASDVMQGSERFAAFMLTKGIENIGTSFPFTELCVADGVTSIPEKLLCFASRLEVVRLSQTVKRIGKNAFTGCVNLRAVTPLDLVTEIGDGAFSDTAIRVLDVPPSVRRIGRALLGVRQGEVEISKYLIKIDSELAEANEGFNVIGEHRCGYVARENGKLKLVYPVRYSGGKPKSLTHDEKMIFKALACSVIDNGDVRQGTFDKVKSSIVGLKNKVFKKK